MVRLTVSFYWIIGILFPLGKEGKGILQSVV